MLVCTDLTKSRKIFWRLGNERPQQNRAGAHGRRAGEIPPGTRHACPGTDARSKALRLRPAKWKIEISIESARSFRNTTFANYLKRIERRREFAERVANVRDNSTGRTLADAAAENLAEQVFDLTEELGEGETLDLKKASTVAFIISKIRQGDVAASALQLKVDEYERKERERAEKNARAAAELEKLRDPNAGLNEEERGAVLDTIDDLLGIKAKPAPAKADATTERPG
jgi:hypothetical protein